MTPSVASHAVAEHIYRLDPAMAMRRSGKKLQSKSLSEMESLRTSRHLADVETFQLEDSGSLRLEPLHAAYYISRELLFSRRQLSVSLANHAAFVSSHMLETEREEEIRKKQQQKLYKRKKSSAIADRAR